VRGPGLCLPTRSGNGSGCLGDGLLGNFLFLFGEVYGYVDAVLLLRFLFALVGLLVSEPEEGPGDCPEDEDDGEEEKDERTFAHACPP